MTLEEVKKLNHGLYKIYWHSGGSSLASVGSDHNGDRWLAPTNWVTISSQTNRNVWKDVKSVKKIAEKISKKTKYEIAKENCICSPERDDKKSVCGIECNAKYHWDEVYKEYEKYFRR